MKTVISVLVLALTIPACTSKQEEQPRGVASQQASAVQPVSFQADQGISVQIVHPRGETVELYSLESKTFEIRTSRSLKEDEYFWLGVSGAFVVYPKSHPEKKPLDFPRSLERVEVTGGNIGTGSFCVVVMRQPKATSIAETCAKVRILPVPEEDSIIVRAGDTLYELSDIYLNDPEKWREVVKKNRFLGEPGRMFKRAGKVIVIIKPGEKLNGLARLGIRISR